MKARLELVRTGNIRRDSEVESLSKITTLGGFVPAGSCGSVVSVRRDWVVLRVWVCRYDGRGSFRLIAVERSELRVVGEPLCLDKTAIVRRAA